MNNKGALKSFISYRWYVFLLIIIFSASFYYYLFEAIKSPSLDETLKVFIAADQVEVTSLENKLNQNIDQSKIKKIAIDFSDPSATYFATILQTRGMVQTDLIILDHRTLENLQFTNLFSPLSETLLADYFITDHLQFLSSDEQKYGILLSQSMLEFVHINIALDYYVLINKDSNKMGDLNHHAINDWGLVALKNLVGY